MKKRRLLNHDHVDGDEEPSTASVIMEEEGETRRRQERKARFETTSNNNDKNKKKRKSKLLKKKKVDQKEEETTGSSSNSTSTCFVGTNLELLKPYLRLTDHPKSCQVRPYHILVKALAHVKTRYLQTEESYDFVHEQLRSIRQDLTVQPNLRQTHFSLDVYETHARILLEHGDLEEYYQCSCQIENLVNNDNIIISQNPTSRMEFLNYRILYALIRNNPLDLQRQLQRLYELEHSPSAAANNNKRPAKKNKKRRNKKRRHHSSREETTATSQHASNTALLSCSSPAPPEDSSSGDTSTGFAWQVVRCVQDGNYHQFFRLYQIAPHLCAYLMDFLVHRIRLNAYNRIVASYRPTLSCEQIRQFLHLDNCKETRQFLKQQHAVFVPEQQQQCQQQQCGSSSSSSLSSPSSFLIDCKESSQRAVSGNTKTR